MNGLRQNRRRRLRLPLALFAVWFLTGCNSTHWLQLQTANADDQFPLSRNFTMKTLGGRQFWADSLYWHGWRIQQNVLTKHYRLLDPEDYRHASGSLENCQDKLGRVKKRLKLPAMKGKAVILVHGIIRSSKSLAKMRKRLQKEGYTVVGFDYPSTRIGIPQAAEYLQNVIESLEGIDQIDFVVHSMGGLIVRQLAGQKKDKRFHRMVMLGVPNHGAELADKLKRVGLYKLLYGPAGQQLSTDKNGLIAKLPTPSFEFAVIAGGKGTLKGYNPIIPGDDDGTVGVASTRLPGAADFMTVRALHSFMMANDDAVDATVRFLKDGCLRADGNRHPIPKQKKPPVEAQRPPTN